MIQEASQSMIGRCSMLCSVPFHTMSAKITRLGCARDTLDWVSLESQCNHRGQKELSHQRGGEAGTPWTGFHWNLSAITGVKKNFLIREGERQGHPGLGFTGISVQSQGSKRTFSSERGRGRDPLEILGSHIKSSQ